MTYWIREIDGKRVLSIEGQVHNIDEILEMAVELGVHDDCPYCDDCDDKRRDMPGYER